MRGKGINYDTGFFPGGKHTRPSFDSTVVRREMQIIADDLHCNAVRISGGEPARLSVAGEHAAEAGLEVWFAPFPCEMTAAEMGPYFDDCAERAEALRRAGAEVVLVTGCEVSLFGAGFIPGDDVYERIATMTSGGPAAWGAIGAAQIAANAFLTETAAGVRRRFSGRISYAAGPWEKIDWDPFDIVSVDAYRSEQNAAGYRDEIRGHFAHGKPVAATEFGCCTYRGASDRGGMGWTIVDDKADPPRLDGDYARDEQEQVTYMRELLEIFEEEGIDSAFWFTFAGYELPHRADPHHDLDMASYGVVKIVGEAQGGPYPDLPWEPKASFHALAAAYGVA